MKPTPRQRQYLACMSILLAFFLWMASHEVWHVLACGLQGLEAESDFLNFTECPGLERASLPGIVAYAMAPYLAGVILIATAWLWRPGKLLDVRAFLPLFALIDVAKNVPGVLKRETDFTILYSNIHTPFPGAAVLAAVLIPGLLYYFYRWREMRRN